jgi:hypothetical protein
MNLNEWVNTYINEISEDENDPQEITVGNYQTRYFHVCPGASTLYKDIESKGVDMDIAERSARLQDALYFVEEHIQRDGYEPDKDYVMVANNIAKNIMKMAKMMGLEKEHDYIQGHVDTIEKVVKEKGLEESIMNLTEKNTPTDPSKWAYYKAQAKKKFDVYPSAYANGWAAKKYKAAGGGWRKSESVNEATPEEEDEFHRNLDKLVHKTFGHSSDEEKMNEASEPEIITQLRSIVSNKQNQKLKDPKSGKQMRVDLYSASAVTQVYDALKQQSNKDKFVGMGLVGMVNTAFKLINKNEINEAIEFSKQQLDTLRKNYSTINKINPSSPTYTKLIKFLNSLDNKALKQIANADVKFLSMLAKNRIKEGEEIEEYDVETLEELNDFHQFMKEYKSDINEGEYQGRDVELGKIMQGDVKKFKVYVKNDKGNVVKVNFGQKGMTIKKDNPGARKSFRARMNCDNPGPRWKARYWSCRKW